MTNSLVEIERKDWTYLLHVSATSDYYFTTIIGTIAMVPLTIKLTDQEVEQYKKDKLFLDRFSKIIASSDRDFWTRKVKLPE